MGKDLCMSSIVCPARRRDAESSNSHFNRKKIKKNKKRYFMTWNVNIIQRFVYVQN
jgi:hypothetical protein